jgi:hypothetical protein
LKGVKWILSFKIYVDFLGGRSKLDATILNRIISKGEANFKLKLFQINSFLDFLEFLISHRKLMKV